MIMIVCDFRKSYQRHARIPSISIEPIKVPDEPMNFSPSPTRVCIIHIIENSGVVKGFL